ncbi:MAG TPA: hypothetical protein DHU56_10595 [Marinobacter sp.]|nr:hypothetical protein [Marinobacter sp.]
MRSPFLFPFTVTADQAFANLTLLHGAVSGIRDLPGILGNLLRGGAAAAENDTVTLRMKVLRSELFVFIMRVPLLSLNGEPFSGYHSSQQAC